MRLPRSLQLIAWTAVMSLAAAAHPEWSPEQQELITLCDEWIAAEVGQDAAALERILDERFLATYASSGKTVDRSVYIAGIIRSRLEPFEVIHEVVNLYGDTALVIDVSTDRTVKFTWIAVRQEGTWRVISETFSRITQTP